MTAEASLEITELVEFDVSKVAGVRSPANGTPILLMKAVAKAPMDGDGDTDGPTHGAFDGKHTHKHTGPDGEMHSHEHSHDGDGDHGHSHAEKSAGPPQWHARAVALARMAVAAPDVPRDVLYKAVTADGQVDEQPDIDGGRQAIMLVGKLIGYEAQELAAGHLDEVCDIQMLCCAADALKCWLGLEQGADNDAGMLMQSAFAYPADGVAKDSREFSAEERKKHAAEGNALPDGSYPVPDADALRRAAILARSKHGNWQAAERLIARRAKELGVPNPLTESKDDDASKSQIAEGETTVDTETQGTGDLAQIVEAAITKAIQPHMERVTLLEAELAKVKATPVPGGPMMAAVPRAKAADGEDHAAKAAYYRQMAETVSQDPAVADGYRQLARQAEDKAKQTA